MKNRAGCRGLLQLAILFTLVPGVAGAAELRDLYRGTRATAMGGAFSAIADDEEAIFINPAGLAGVRGLTFNYAAVDIETSTDLIALGTTGASLLNNITGNTLNSLQGQNLFAHMQIAPSLVMPNFGIAFLSDHQVALNVQNQAFPLVNLGYQSTNGIQAAYGTSLLGRNRRSDLRVGIAGKLMWRRGGYHALGFLDLLKLTQDPTYLNTITGSYGRGYGADLGTQYLFNLNKRFTLSSAVTMTDIGDTSFSDSLADPQKSDLTFGLGATLKLSKARVNMAYDYKHALSGTDFRGHSHLGLEAVLPFITLEGGLYQMMLSYGASFDLWIFRITAASYGEEQATFGGQNPERRYALRIALKFGF